jgi:hypothetical protein
MSTLSCPWFVGEPSAHMAWQQFGHSSGTHVQWYEGTSQCAMGPDSAAVALSGAALGHGSRAADRPELRR